MSPRLWIALVYVNASFSWRAPTALRRPRLAFVLQRLQHPAPAPCRRSVAHANPAVIVARARRLSGADAQQRGVEGHRPAERRGARAAGRAGRRPAQPEAGSVAVPLAAAGAACGLQLAGAGQAGLPVASAWLADCQPGASRRADESAPLADRGGADSGAAAVIAGAHRQQFQLAACALGRKLRRCWAECLPWRFAEVLLLGETSQPTMGRHDRRRWWADTHRQQRTGAAAPRDGQRLTGCGASWPPAECSAAAIDAQSSSISTRARGG